MVGSVWPALSVPGMIRSGTIFLKRKTEVVVANDPIPSESRKLVAAPSPIWNAVGMRASVAGLSPRPVRRRAAMMARLQSEA